MIFSLTECPTIASPPGREANLTAPAAEAAHPFVKQRFVKALLLVVLACLIGISWLAYRNIHAAAGSEHRETHSREVLQALGDILSSLKDAETEQRGFIITGNPDYLEPYYTNLDTYSTSLADLRRLTADNANQQQRIAAITPLVTAKLEDLEETIGLRETKGLSAAIAAVTARSGKKTMDQIRVLVIEARVQESLLLESLAITSKANIHRTNQSVVLWGALGGFALLLLFLALRWELASRRRAETSQHTSEDQYHSLFNSIDEGFCILEVIFDAHQKPIDFRYLEVNPAFEIQTGMRDVAGKCIRELVPDIEAHWFEIYGNVALTGKPHRCVNKAQALDARWFDIYAFRPSGPQSSKVAVLFCDITDSRHAREEILRLNAELEERVRQRTAQLEAANKELEAFSYSVSHDLRSPLNTIDGFSQLMEQVVRSKADEKGQHYLGRIRTATRQMSELIDALLSLTTSSHDTLQFGLVNLTAIARRTAHECRERDPDRQTQIHIQNGMQAHGDPRLLSVVIQNLLGNAWKFTSRRALAQIEIGSEAGETGETVYFVKDNGAGFDMAHAEKLFGTFARLHSHADFLGTGIGLATVKRVIERHGGRVWAEGKTDAGATFYFTLRQEAETSTAP